MRLLMRSFLFMVGALLLIWFLRGPMFRATVHYRIVGERAPVQVLKASRITMKDLDAAVEVALDTTAARLHFSTGRVDNDPRTLSHGSAANCIGYAALFAALLKGHLVDSGLGEKYDVGHEVGKLFIREWDLHSAFDGPFWKDHDIVRITDKKSGTVMLIDPTLYDAVGIGRVRARGD